MQATQKDYRLAVKRAMLDYVLIDLNEQKRLGIRLISTVCAVKSIE